MTVNEIIEKILTLRGISAAEIGSFLNPSLADLAKPEELDGVIEAADIVLEAVVAKRKIVIFGDYDCDGVSATAILVKTLMTLGASVEPFLPDRLSEGYGMSDGSVARMLKEFPDVGLIITVDNGINSIAQIAELRAKGVRVVITDHHLPGEALPEANALVNPKVAAPPKLGDLCGAGVAFLLANRIVSEAKRRGIYAGGNLGGPLLILAGLATVTDIMPLIGQNRIIVAEALKRFHSWAPLGLKELHTRAARNVSDRLTSKDFGFMLGPRINAAGRLKTGMEALELILSDDYDIARELARIVDLHNTDRKAIEIKMTEEALEKVVKDAPAQVIDLPQGHPGVAGIVAARVLERIGGMAPVCVLAGGHGSARSPEGLNIRDAFVACSQHLTTYGGHAAAGGFSVKPGEVDKFRAALCAYCAERRDALSDSRRKQEADLEIHPEEITLELAEAIEQLEPFGEANPEPIFVLRDVRFSDVKPLGAEGRHLSVTIATSPRLRGVWWSHGDMVEELRMSGGALHDVYFNLIASDYGERHAELHLVRID